MSAITPSTNVKLLKLPLELDNENQLTFSSVSAQYSYFNSLPSLAVNKFTYQRKDGVIRFPAHVDSIINYNYVMYQNEAYSNKWFYAYIDRMVFVNNETTDIYIRTDPFQTWQFDITFLSSFVEREHVNDDTVGAHTVPEGLDLGEYEIVDLRNSPLDPDEAYCYAFCVTEYPKDSNDDPVTLINGETQKIGGVFTSLHFCACVNEQAARNFITVYNEKSDTKAEAIKNIYVVPRCMVNYDPSTANLATGGVATVFTSSSVSAGVYVYPLYDSGTQGPYTIQQPSVLAENYTPVNKKLLTYPYSYFYITNKVGTDVVYKWEDFPFKTIDNVTARTVEYKKAIVPSTSVSAKLYFTNYKSHAESTGYGTRLYNYGVNYGKTPICAWTTDYFTNWLTQNGVNMATSVIGATLSGAIVGGGAMAASGFVGSALNAVSEIYKASVTPDQAQGDVNCGDVMFAYTTNAISIYEMSVRPEVARIIDKFFSMFGYKVNINKVPNITGRRNWNYVKTIRGKIHGLIPKEDLNTISGMLDNGVTFWHSASTFLDYSQTNDII